MSENTFSPHSKQEDEREIVRIQNDFSSGVYRDIPASELPDDGISDLKNMKDFGAYLEGRSGSKEWGDYSTFTSCAELPVLISGISSSSTVVGNERTVTGLSDTTFNDYKIGDYFIHDDGTHERITSIISNSVLTTRTETSDSKSSSNAKIRDKVNGIYFHSYSRKVILVIGTKIYISNDYTMTQWIECSFIGKNTISNSISTFGELNQYLLIFNANGIYRLNTEDFPYEIYRINSAVPTSMITNSTSSGAYVKRYSYTLSRILNTGLTGNRLTSGAVLIQESGNVDRNSTGKDYTEYYSSSEFSDSSRIINNLDVSRNSEGIPEQHWTHYSLYATLDIGNNGFDPVRKEANNSEVYIWIEDIPIMKPMIASVYNTTIIGADPNVSDFYSTFSFFNTTTNRYEEHQITGYVDDEYESDTSGTFENVPFCIGGKQPFEIIQSSGVISITTTNINQTVSFDHTTDTVVLNNHGFNAGERVYFYATGGLLPTEINQTQPYYVIAVDTNSFQIAETYSDYINDITLSFTDNGTGTLTVHYAWITSDDINKVIQLSDGTRRTIKDYNDVEITVYENTSDYDISTPVVACIDSVPRNCAEITSDDVLRTRDGDPFYLMSLRFYKPLPSSDIGEIEAGFMFTAVRDESFLYYSGIPDGFEYYSGYYHPAYQYARFKGSVRAIKSLPDRLVVYLANSTYTVPLNVFETIDLSTIGLVIPVIAGHTLADATIGLLDYGSLADLEIGKHIMITNEPAIRIFDGNQYSENVASQRFMNDLRELQVATSAIYDPRIGYNFWGLTE